MWVKDSPYLSCTILRCADISGNIYLFILIKETIEKGVKYIQTYQ